MDLEIKIKEEPAGLEGTTNASLEHFEHVSEVIALKEEVKSELAEPGSSQENFHEPSEDTKEEIFIDEQVDEKLLPYLKEETKYVQYKFYTIWNMLYLFTVVFSSGWFISKSGNVHQFNPVFTRLHLNTNI
ncbi:uncharacterized protein [Anabrus simplex]|uniref:uncharacterized protein n=1 Tax=Anabrus simplex TaxID=316456 RepID=UPI0035A2A28F